jgi:hypothetical protein
MKGIMAHLRKLRLLLLTSGLLLVLAVEAAAQYPTGRLRGMVVIQTADGREMPAADFRVLAVGNYEQANGRTGKDGSFVLELPEGEWEIRVIAEGYQQPQKCVGIVYLGRESQVNPDPVVLKPTTRSPGKARPSLRTAPRRRRAA